MIEKHFSQLLKIMLDTGHITEKFYNVLGFPKDEVSSFVYDQNDGIERENGCNEQNYSPIGFSNI